MLTCGAHFDDFSPASQAPSSKVTHPASPSQPAADAAALATPDLRAIATRMADALEAERLRLARDMHDDLGQLLAALKLEVAGLSQVAHGPGAGPRIATMNTLIDSTILAVRRISNNLRPLLLDDLGLNSAVESLARTAAERMGIEVTVRHDEQDPPVQPGVATALYRMVQEALTNVGRHARATDARVELRVLGPEVVLVVEDNGIGLPSDALDRQGCWGLRGMRERATLYSGTLVMDNAPGSGARLTARLPLEATGASA